MVETTQMPCADHLRLTFDCLLLLSTFYDLTVTFATLTLRELLGEYMECKHSLSVEFSLTLSPTKHLRVGEKLQGYPAPM